MRTALALVACSAIGCGSAPAHRTMSDDEIDAIPNAFPSTLEPPIHAEYATTFATLATYDPFVAAGKLASLRLSLGNVRIPITVEECGEANATYNPNNRSIRLCYELVADANRMRGKLGSEVYEVDATISRWLLFVALHEIGHALVDVLDLPATAADAEDLADQYAALTLSVFNDRRTVELLMPVVTWFAQHGERQDGRSSDQVHRAGADRAIDVLCILAARVNSGTPECTAFSTRVTSRWNAMLAPYTRIDTGNTF